MKKLLYLFIVLFILFNIGFFIYNRMEIQTKYVAFGDSITEYDGTKAKDGTTLVGYTKYITDYLGIYGYNNQGFAGYTLANVSNANLVNVILNSDNRYIEVCTIFIGTNDFTSDVIIGDLSPKNSDFDDQTFIGAYQKSIEYLMNDNPNMQIVLITPTRRAEYTCSERNANGNTLDDYANAVLEVANFYDLPVCDLYNECDGFTLNIDDCTVDGLHPNNKGYETIGNFVVQYMTENDIKLR